MNNRMRFSMVLATTALLAACSSGVGVGVGVGVGGGNSHIGVRGTMGGESGSRTEAYGQIGVGMEATSR